MGLLDIRNLNVCFDTPDGKVEAVRKVSFTISAGECLGVVGESGSGKSQTFLAAMGLLSRNGSATGSIRLEGRELLGLPATDLNRVRGSRMTMIFQESLTSLTPHLKIGDQMAEIVRVHKSMRGAEIRRLCKDWLDRVRMPDAAHRLLQYPHELSGGQRQRILIAMAMLLSPKLLIADEPTTALDVTVQPRFSTSSQDFRRAKAQPSPSSPMIWAWLPACAPNRSHARRRHCRERHGG